MELWKKDLYVIAFSGGRSSAYMTHQLLLKYPERNFIICFSNTGKEEPATLEFVRLCGLLWNREIVWLEYDTETAFRRVDYDSASRQGEPYECIIRKRNYLPNVVARFCTQELKIRPTKKYIQSLGFKTWTSCIGIRYDEPARWSKTRNTAHRECWEVWLPMVDWKTTRQQVLDFWKSMPFDLELRNHEGNCDLCFLKGKAKLSAILRKDHHKADWWIKQEDGCGATFHKNFSYRHFRDLVESQPTLFDGMDNDFPCFCNAD